MTEITITGNQIDLGDGRYVFVAVHEDRFYIKFCNAEGKRTRMMLSKDAGEALEYLLGEHAKPNDLMQKFLVHMTVIAEEAKSKMAWQEVKPETAPVAAD